MLSDVVKNDASVGEDYAPVGYYGDFQIRGFPIDLATGLQINGMTIAGEQDVPLENKESVEIVKGIAGVESGVAAAGGLINYVTKEPRRRCTRRSTWPRIIAAHRMAHWTWAMSFGQPSSRAFASILPAKICTPTCSMPMDGAGWARLTANCA